MIAFLPTAQSVSALSLGIPQSTIAYQGRFADADDHLLFWLYGRASGGAPLWKEQWIGSNGVRGSDGLFNVVQGSLTPIPQEVITGYDKLFLGITVGMDD